MTTFFDLRLIPPFLAIAVAASLGASPAAVLAQARAPAAGDAAAGRVLQGEAPAPQSAVAPSLTLHKHGVSPANAAASPGAPAQPGAASAAAPRVSVVPRAAPAQTPKASTKRKAAPVAPAPLRLQPAP